MLVDAVRSIVILPVRYSIPTALEIAEKIGCLECGDCCREVGNIRVTEDELEKIRDYLHSDVDAPKSTPCPFQEGNECLIHPARMLVCKLFPTTMKNDRVALYTDCLAVAKLGVKQWL